MPPPNLIDATGREVRLGAVIGKGGEGTVYAVASSQEVVANIGGELINVDEDAVFAVEAFAHIKKRLILAGVATGVEVIIAADLWRADDADVEELREPGIDLVAAREGVKHVVGIGRFLLGKSARYRDWWDFRDSGKGPRSCGPGRCLRRERSWPWEGRKETARSRNDDSGVETDGEKEEDRQQAQTSEHKHLTFGVEHCGGRDTEK